jgi:hypothetical protein
LQYANSDQRDQDVAAAGSAQFREEGGDVVAGDFAQVAVAA